MIYVGLDLSLNSTGYAIADDSNKLLTVGRIRKCDYCVSVHRNKYARMHEDSLAIADRLMYLLLPYRTDSIQLIIEEVAFGYAFRPGSTNSVYQLLFEGATVAALLSKQLHCGVDFVAASVHKKSFTGSGKAKKEQSIAAMLALFPSLSQAADKLDDIADAMSILSTKLRLSEYALNSNKP